MTNIEIAGIIFGLLGSIGSCIAIYQKGVMNESKKRKSELQYILAAINSLANQKQQFWQNQINLLSQPETPEQWEIARLHMRAKDSFAEIASQAMAMEGIIDADESAIDKMGEKGLEAIKRSNLMQEEFQKGNPIAKKQETQ